VPIEGVDVDVDSGVDLDVEAAGIVEPGRLRRMRAPGPDADAGGATDGDVDDEVDGLGAMRASGEGFACFAAPRAGTARPVAGSITNRRAAPFALTLPAIPGDGFGLAGRFVDGWAVSSAHLG